METMTTSFSSRTLSQLDRIIFYPGPPSKKGKHTVLTSDTTAGLPQQTPPAAHEAWSSHPGGGGDATQVEGLAGQYPQSTARPITSGSTTPVVTNCLPRGAELTADFFYNSGHSADFWVGTIDNNGTEPCEFPLQHTDECLGNGVWSCRDDGAVAEASKPKRVHHPGKLPNSDKVAESALLDEPGVPSHTALRLGMPRYSNGQDPRTIDNMSISTSPALTASFVDVDEHDAGWPQETIEALGIMDTTVSPTREAVISAVTACQSPRALCSPSPSTPPPSAETGEVNRSEQPDTATRSQNSEDAHGRLAAMAVDATPSVVEQNHPKLLHRRLSVEETHLQDKSNEIASDSPTDDETPFIPRRGKQSRPVRLVRDDDSGSAVLAKRLRCQSAADEDKWPNLWQKRLGQSESFMDDGVSTSSSEGHKTVPTLRHALAHNHQPCPKKKPMALPSDMRTRRVKTRGRPRRATRGTTATAQWEAAPHSFPCTSEDAPTWAVDRIVSSVHKYGKVFYKVQWKPTWEPAESLQGTAEAAIADFSGQNSR